MEIWTRIAAMEIKKNGGFRIGNSCTLVEDSCQCMAKPIQYCKVKKKEYIKKRKMGRVGKVVGEGFRVGNSCTPVVDSCQGMAKPIQYCKVKKKKKNVMLC